MAAAEVNREKEYSAAVVIQAVSFAVHWLARSSSISRSALYTWVPVYRFGRNSCRVFFRARANGRTLVLYRCPVKFWESQPARSVSKALVHYLGIHGCLLFKELVQRHQPLDLQLQSGAALLEGLATNSFVAISRAERSHLQDYAISIGVVFPNPPTCLFSCTSRSPCCANPSSPPSRLCHRHGDDMLYTFI